MLRFYDSFSHYIQAFMAKKWDVCEFGTAESSMTQDLTSGRFGGGGVTFATNPAAWTANFIKAYMQKNYDGVGTVVVGLAVKQTGTQYAAADPTSQIHGGRLLTFMAGNSVQVRLTITQSGQIEASHGVAANLGLFPVPVVGVCFTILGTSASAISSSSYDFLEVKVVHHPTAGSIEIKRNGAAFWTLSGVNTDVAGLGNSSSVIVGGGHWGTQAFAPLADPLKAIVSDFHIIDTVAGSSARDLVNFAGDLRGERLTPTADGNYTEWDPNPGPNHFANIDEIPPNDNTDYNSTGVLNERDTFVVSDSTAPTTATVKAVVLTMYCRKDNGGTNGLKGMMRLAGADGVGTEFQTPSDYAFRQSFIFDTPAGAAITVANVNSSEFGYQRSS